MTKRVWMLLLTGLLLIGLPTGCAHGDADASLSSAPPATTTTSKAAESVSTTVTTSTTTTALPSTTQTTATTAAVVTTTTAPSAVKPTTTTTTTKATTTTIADPNRVTVNGKEYAVGDTFRYTVMVKTAENYGTAKIGVRCLRKGLEVPNGTFQKQNQYVMQNLGVGRWGTMPEDTVGQNGFTMTSNKGYQLDTATAGYAGLLWYYETTDYDYSALSSREIDCSGGVALFTIELKITKPGEYVVDCMEYANHPRTDLTVWGAITKA